MVCWDVSKERGRVLQLFTHVNSGVALHVTRRGGVGFRVQDRRLLANTHWPSTTNNTEATRQFLDLSIRSVNMSLTHSRRDLFRVFDIGFGQIEGILGIILAKEFFKKSN